VKRPFYWRARYYAQAGWKCCYGQGVDGWRDCGVRHTSLPTAEAHAAKLNRKDCPLDGSKWHYHELSCWRPTYAGEFKPRKEVSEVENMMMSDMDSMKSDEMDGEMMEQPMAA